MVFEPKDMRELLFGAEKKKLKRKRIPKAVKVSVWSKYIGATKAEGKCYVCKRTIHITRFEVGHNKSVARGGSDNITNLRPICRSCNLAMGTMSIETYKRKFYSKSAKKKTTKKRSKAKPRRKRRKKEVIPSLEDLIL